MIGLRLPRGIPDGLIKKLAEAKIYVSLRGDAIRVAPHLYNSREDIDRLFEVLP
jgi:selenocysteine lyase/cysteine desulfurase